MRILLTNDDGIQAEGLACLERIAARLSDDVWVVAPDREQSGAGRSLTLSEPVRVHQQGERRFAVGGTPTDCVMLAVRNLIPDKRPDLVLSGVNRGQNIAEDVTMSGTVAGAIEAMALGIPGIALSQAMFAWTETDVPHWETAEHWAPGVIQRLVQLGWPSDVVMNLNFPSVVPDAVTEIEVTRQGFRDEHIRAAEKRTDPRGRDYYWIGFNGKMSRPSEGTDLRAVYEGKISVTPLHIDLTHNATVNHMKGLIGGAPPRLDP